MARPAVFISYSREDEKEKNLLLSHLNVLQRQGLIDLWSDDRIGAGAEWQVELEQAITQAEIAILLITANFLTSDFTLGEQVPTLLQRRENDGLVIFPIIAKACAWRTVEWLTKMEVRPRGGDPVWHGQDRQVDGKLASISEEIANILTKETVGVTSTRSEISVSSNSTIYAETHQTSQTDPMFLEVSKRRGCFAELGRFKFAVVLSILVLFLVGAFESGSIIRSYLALVNVNREITRFAIRPGYLDFSTQGDRAASYAQVKEWANQALSDQFITIDDTPQIDSTGRTTLIISHVVVDTGLPCEEILNCECEAFVNNPDYPNSFTFDDLVVYPDKPGMEYQRDQFGPTETGTGQRTTRVDLEQLIYEELVPQNNKLNCEIIKKGGLPSSNNVIITELFFDKPFDVPIISNFFTASIPLYTSTTMRLIGGARSSSGGELTGSLDLYDISLIGPVCLAYPMTVPQSVIDSATIGDEIHIFGGPSHDQQEWLAWNPAQNDAQYLNYELQYPQMSLNDYTNPLDRNDNVLNVGDHVKALNSSTANNDTENLVIALVGQTIIIPIWDDTNRDGFISISDPTRPTDMIQAYHISSFAKVLINDIEMGSDREIRASFRGDASDLCQ